MPDPEIADELREMIFAALETGRVCPDDIREIVDGALRAYEGA